MKFHSTCRKRNLGKRETGEFLNFRLNFQQESYHLQGLSLAEPMFLLADEGNLTPNFPLGGSLQGNCLRKKKKSSVILASSYCFHPARLGVKV